MKEETNCRQNESSQEISVKPGQKTSCSVVTNSSSGGLLKITTSKVKSIGGIPPQGLEIRHLPEEDEGETLRISILFDMSCYCLTALD